MAEYKSRRVRRRAAGGATGGEGASPPHGHMIIMIGLVAKKPKAGGKVDGKAARKHLGKRARGGAPKRADGGPAGTDDNYNAFMQEQARQNALEGDKNPSPWSHEGRGSAPAKPMNASDKFEQAGPARPMRSTSEPPVNFQKQARGGRTLDAREDANDPDQDGRDKVSRGMGTAERAVEMGDPRKRGGGVHIKASHKGLLHSEMGIPQGKPIPTAKLEIA